MTNATSIKALDAQAILNVISREIGNNSADLEYSCDHACVRVSSDIEGLPKDSVLEVSFYAINKYEGFNDPKSETGEYLVWDFHDFELDYIEVKLASGESLDAEIDDEDTLCDTMVDLFNNALCVDFMAHENADLVGYYGATNPLVQG